jgi:hypothetical protein
LRQVVLDFAQSNEQLKQELQKQCPFLFPEAQQEEQPAPVDNQPLSTTTTEVTTEVATAEATEEATEEKKEEDYDEWA